MTSSPDAFFSSAESAMIVATSRASSLAELTPTGMPLAVFFALAVAFSLASSFSSSPGGRRDAPRPAPRTERGPVLGRGRRSPLNARIPTPRPRSPLAWPDRDLARGPPSGRPSGLPCDERNIGRLGFFGGGRLAFDN